MTYDELLTRISELESEIEYYRELYPDGNMDEKTSDYYNFLLKEYSMCIRSRDDYETQSHTVVDYPAKTEMSLDIFFGSSTLFLLGCILIVLILKGGKN